MKDNEIKKNSVFLVTFGCQMNAYDTEVAAGILEAAGFHVVEEDGGAALLLRAPHLAFARKQRGEAILEIASPLPAPRNDGVPADVILINTCSVREHAEDRVYSRLGRLGKEKKANPNLIVGLMGCMVEEHKEKLFKRFPELDFMVGTRNIREIPSLIERVAKTREKVSRIRNDGLGIEYTDLIKRESKFHAWLPIMTGCDKVCTYCIVPITRGREVSMPAREVCREASRLVLEGVKWITLLGQNVNSYKGTVEGGGWRVKGKDLSSTFPPKDGSAICLADDHRSSSNFSELLEMLCRIAGLERISFTTSHPQDATAELFQVIAKNPKISRRLHLPLQSASNRVLKRMKRLHTYDEYHEKIRRARELVPDISVTTDLVAGFSGETEEDHEETLRALREIRFAGAYIYKYSLRPSTPAEKLKDTVPENVKARRHAELLKLQNEITAEENRKWVGRTVTVFTESQSTKDAMKLVGRTSQDKRVVFEGGLDQIGCFVNVRLESLRNETFVGTRAD